MDDLEKIIAQYAAAHPRVVLVAAGLLLLTNTVNAATSKVDLLALEERSPRLAGLIWIARGLGQIARWVYRGLVLFILNRRPEGPAPESVP